MSKGAQVLQNAIEVECHDILRGVDGKTSGCLFHGDEAERLIDAAVAPLVEPVEELLRDYLRDELEDPEEAWDERQHELLKRISKALETWRTGR